ncbi:MAG: hypothetical protein JO001_06850, partial [Alphaproteobacteria bacterium]|nr:hypothetical protein [Alphaproteobacteria bacterium]
MWGRAAIFCVLAVATVIASRSSSADIAIGAIPGTFGVSLSGSSNYSIPIKIGPGAAGTQPKIQLDYDSQTLSGPVGAGWSISGISAITRGPKDAFVDGRPAGINFDDNDALYIDGQRLVEVPAPPGHAPGATYYRKVNDDYSEVVRYGPSLERSYFRVRTKGGLTLVFGNPGNATTSSPDPVRYDATILIHRDKAGDSTKDHALLFAESVAIDTAGNFIAFHYKQNGNGDYNIDEIIYTGHGSIDDAAVITVDRDPFASVTFQYQDAPRPLDAYVSGGLLRKEKTLSDIYSCVSDATISYPFDCGAATLATDTRVHQVSHYHLHYEPTETANRLVLTKVHMFGADDAIEISPTAFTYTTPSPGWDLAADFLPLGLTLANIDHIAQGYRFAHVDPASTGGLDLLFAAQINGKNVAFAFKNAGSGSWKAGSQPWIDDGKTDPQNGQVTGFAPPVSFVDEDGSDLGVITADVDGSGRAAIMQSDVRAKQPSRSAYLPGAQQYEAHPEYNLPFIVSQDGKVVANYRFGKWTGGAGPDLIYESGDQRGFLKNAGPGANLGWLPQGGPLPTIPLDSRTHLVDLDCSGDPPALVGPGKNADGSLGWKIFRYTAAGWREDADAEANRAPPFPPDTDPEAVREVRFDGPSSKCTGLIVASAKTNTHLAVVPDPSRTTGWKSIDDKTPPFDLVDASGRPSKAIVANLENKGYDGIVASTLLPDGTSIAFAFTQDSARWHPASQFVPTASLSSLDPRNPVFSFVGPIVGQGGDDIAILNDQRVTSSTDEGRNRQFGQFYTNDGSGFVPQTSFAPPIQFATKDKLDTGVRFVDLHGTGLPDAIYSRLVTKNGKTYLETGAYRNMGHGWVEEGAECTDSNDSFDTSKTDVPLKDGLCPPIPFTGAEITGNPVQFVDLDGDGYADMIYSYQDKAGNLVTKIYFNKRDESGAGNRRKWVDATSDSDKFGKYMPPPGVFPLAASGVGDMGVRFAKFDAHQVGVLKSFRDGATACGAPSPNPFCPPTVRPLNRSAFVFDGNAWANAGAGYLPPIPFVTQYSSAKDHSIDLFIQLLDVTGGGLPCIVAYYQDPVDGSWQNDIWTNDGTRWVDSGIRLPQDAQLDAVYRDSTTLVQMIDINGDGLPDIVMTKGSAPSKSKTWTGTGLGWIDAPDWQIPADAISAKEGDPGFRLVNTKGDGYLDVLWLRPNENGQPKRGLALNNGHDWNSRKDDVVPPDITFIDGDGVDQGVRLLNVTGKGVIDIVSSFAGSQKAYINRARRADVLSSVTDGYGIKTTVAYETLLEYDCSDSPSGADCDQSRAGVRPNPLGWRAYERESPDTYPKVAPVPTAYVVRQSIVDEADGNPPVAIDYRYGKYEVDANASRSLGFGWRESLNEFSKTVTRSEMVQDARARASVAVETSCIVNTDVLTSMVTKALESLDPKDRFPVDLCEPGNLVAFAWGRKISENETCWNVVEGDMQGHLNETQLPAVTSCVRPDVTATSGLTGQVVRQSTIWKSVSASYELDGQVISRSTNTFRYDPNGGILDRHGNLLSSTAALADGSSIETTNEYADDVAHWFLGRLTKAVVKKIGDPIGTGPDRQTETRRSCFRYDDDTGLLLEEDVN